MTGALGEKAAARREAARLLDRFVAAGAVPVETAILQPAGALLDLYGEDIRARAFTTSDPLRGERMLRPDFTVPVVLMHMEQGAEPARYAYAGEIFRRQEHDAERAAEYFQAGFEIFDRTDPAAADAEVFALIAEQLRTLDLDVVTGDIGILSAAVQGLRLSDRRKAALMRHIWRPERFRRLVERFGAPPPPRPLLDAPDPLEDAGPEIGLRGRGEVETRLERLRRDREEPPLAAEQVTLLDGLLSLSAPSDAALAALRAMEAGLPSIAPANDALERRLDALERRGIAPRSLLFEAGYGRASMEYYSGFVFGFHAAGRPDLPVVATGGRYDALTRHLGQGAAIPAVGGVIRPGLCIELSEGRT
ncbi:ATP phosphoribosyltransferase regulatory subunit [Profundibacterium mesophilum]|uniref:Histidine--tRNA ligase n=1 Tax=Profundibacterium mesophilum KAUST100406-0324 TaxID=1037889 RepID=A0A921NWQ2_9RHOB|nr:ATP phosphoribosyltransferase regulatory subunit [Profundibacterium mesophilum]KAF0676840.1 ATP phosphoribosyltransferase regulatory subunit [Profundibacterium mesophilum KAUST100406-0324]